MSEINKKKNELDLKQAINYAMNKDKTEEQYFVDGINCEVESAFQEMHLLTSILI